MPLMISIFLWMLFAAAQAQLVIRFVPSDCGSTLDADCRPALAHAIERCRQHGTGGCSIVLAPARFRVACPAGTFGDYGYISTPGAVDLSNTTNVSFGAASPEAPALIDADYIANGCPAVAASAARDLTVQNLVLDTVRLPFTVGYVISTSVDRRSVRFKMAEPGRSEWNTVKYPWLRWVAGGGMDGLVASSWDQNAGVATLNFSASGTHLCTQSCLLKHFANMQSWGLYGWKVQGFFKISGVVLHSAAGMGVRCDLCNGTFSFVDSAVKPAAGRTMSSTADGVHLMHHTGHILMHNSTINGTGDDCFNAHGNFIVLSSIDGADRRSAHYIDETGSGWIPGLGEQLIGDRVAFFSRLTLQRIGSPNVLVSGTGGFGENATLLFRDPVPEGVLRYDMLISLDRTTSLDVQKCSFFRQNSAI